MTDTERNEIEKEDKTEKVLRVGERDGKQDGEEMKQCVHFSGSNLHLSSIHDCSVHLSIHPNLYKYIIQVILSCNGYFTGQEMQKRTNSGRSLRPGIRKSRVSQEEE